MTKEIPADRDRWHMFYPVSSPVYWASGSGGGEPEQAERAYYCAAGNISLVAYDQCYCGAIR